MGLTPRSRASERIVSAPMPAVSAMAIAPCSTRSRLSGIRFLLSLLWFQHLIPTLALSYIVR